MNGAITSAEEIAAVANTCVLYFFVSLYLFLIFSVGVAIWLVYGILIDCVTAKPPD